MFIGGLMPGTMRSELEEELSKLGRIDGLRIPRDKRSNQQLYFAFFELVDQRDLHRFLECSIVVHGRELQPQVREGHCSTHLRIERGASKRLYVAGLPKTFIDNNLLADALSCCGDIRSAYAIKDSKGRPKGFGFVDFWNDINVTEVISMSHKLSFMGHSLILKAFKKSNGEQCKDYTGGERVGHLNSSHIPLKKRHIPSCINNDFRIPRILINDYSRTNNQSPFEESYRNKLDGDNIATHNKREKRVSPDLFIEDSSHYKQRINNHSNCILLNEGELGALSSVLLRSNYLYHPLDADYLKLNQRRSPSLFLEGITHSSINSKI